MICGIDPGIDGALALLDRAGNALDVVDMPTIKVRIGGTLRARVDPHGLRGKLLEWAPAHVVIEEIAPRKGDGARAVVLGIAFGQAEGVVVGLGLPLVLASPREWRRQTGVSAESYDGRKAQSLIVARNLFPGMAVKLKAAAHADRAEALLLARWGLKARALGMVAA